MAAVWQHGRSGEYHSDGDLEEETPKKKRKIQLRWNEEKEVQLLKQIHAELPFKAEHGKSDAFWVDAIKPLYASPAFAAGLTVLNVKAKFSGY